MSDALVIFLVILCGLVWCPILLYQLIHRGFLVLLIWICIGPVATNLIEKPGQNPFFTPEPVQEVNYIVAESHSSKRAQKAGGYLSTPTTITLKEILEPTRTLILGLFVVFLLRALLLKGQPLAPLDTSERWMVVFTLLLVASALFQSRRVAFGLRVAVDAFVVPFLTYFVTKRFVTDEERFRRLVKIIGYTGFYLIVIALIERLARHELFHRLRGPFEFRDLLYIAVTTAFFTMLSDQRRGQASILSRGVRGFVLGLAPVVVFLTWTRGNWLGFLIGLWVFLFLARHLIKLSQKVVMIGLVLILVPVGVMSTQMLTPEEVARDRVANVGNVYGRFGTWLIALQQVSEHPVFGIGLNNVRDVLTTTRMRLEGARSLTTAHNSLLAILVELGVVGLVAYLAIVVSILSTCLRLYHRGTEVHDRWRGIGGLAILVAHLISSLTSTILYKPDISHTYVFAYLGGIAGLYGSATLRGIAGAGGRRLPRFAIDRRVSLVRSATP